MVKLLGELTSIPEAIDRAIEWIRLELEVVEEEIERASGRILAEDFYAMITQPMYDRASVDGYAVRSIDTLGASINNPAVLKVKGLMVPGDPPSKYSIGSGEAVEIHTGAPLPRGSDAVVMYEDTRRIGDEVEVYRPVPSYGNVSRKGEDFRRGELLLKAPHRLRPWDIGIIASNGARRVKIYEKLRIGLIVTGSEVYEPGQRISGSGLYNSTGYLVWKFLEELGFTRVNYYGIVMDNPEMIREAVHRALEDNHIVVTTGGTSVSGSDYVRDVIDDEGKWIVRGVAMRPGRPTSIALLNDKPVFLLSGYPVAAWTGLEALVRPIIYRSLGLQPPPRPVVWARLKAKIPNVVGYRSYIRVRVWRENGEYYVEPYMLKGSGVLSSLVRSNGYIVIPENVEGLGEGETVKVYVFR